MRKFGKEHLIAQALNPTHLIEYQSGSIVSQTIIERDVGTITLFAFDEGQGLSEHTTPYDALVYVLDGKAEVTILNKTYHLRREQMVIMPANQPHSLKAVKKFKMLLIMIKS